jgi:hypothetical protein
MWITPTFNTKSLRIEIGLFLSKYIKMSHLIVFDAKKALISIIIGPP